MSSTPPQIGRYRTLGVLGEGGMGKVYLAEHPELGCQLAIKVLLFKRGADLEARQRFEREVRALSQLRHPSLVEVLDTGEQDGIPWLAMRRVEGGSLKQRLKTHGTLPPAEVISLGLQLCEALSVAHEREILHRDLKPDNVLCAPEGRYVVTDFGLSKDLSHEESVQLSQTGALQGTPGYWAPEQARGKGREATPQTDVYGIGAVLYTALTNARPIPAESLIESVVATLERKPIPPSQLCSVPPDLEQIVLRCLEKDPGERWSSAEELRLALASCVHPEPDSRSLRPLAPALGVALFVLGVVVVAALVATFLSPDEEVASALPPSSLPTLAAESSKAPRQEASPSSPSVTPSRVTAPLTPPSPTPLTPRAQAVDTEALIARAGEAAAQGRLQEAVELYREAAEEGHTGAILALARALIQGKGVRKDQAEATRWYARAAEQGSARGMVGFGFSLGKGRGVPKDETQAATWFRRAAEKGNLGGMYHLACALEEGLGVEKDPAQAGVWFGRAAKGGYGAAMHRLGKMHQSGEGASRDWKQAAHWLRRAAEAGQLLGMFDWAEVQRKGHGVPKDEAGAVLWYGRLAAKGYPKAMSKLAHMLARGQGAPKDMPRSVALYRQAASLGDLDAMNALGHMRCYGQGVPRDPQAGYRWYRRAAERNHVLSMFSVGSMLSSGNGVARDEPQAALWFERAATAGHKTSMHKLAGLLLAGRGVARDDAEAVEWLRRASEDGFPPSMILLGSLLRTGRGAPRDDVQAVQWFRRAATASYGNNQLGMLYLGQMLRDGRGVDQDKAKAAEWFRRAAETKVLSTRKLAQEALKELGVE